MATPGPVADAPAVYTNAILLGLFSAIIAILDLPPLIWHAKHRNMAAASLVFWIILLNFTNFINAIIWPNADLASRYDGQGLCDIQVKYTVASWAGLPCAVAAILRGLTRVMDPENVILAPTSSQRRRNLVIDILLVWACPVYLIAFHYIVQSNRYYIWSIAGCNPSVDNSWLSVVMIFIWPCIFALVDGYYAVLLMVRLYRYRSQFRAILSAHNTTKSRFLRLFLISLVCIVGLVPLSFWILAQNLAVSHHGFSWSRVHDPQTWNSVVFIDNNGEVLFDRWIRLGAGILIFAFFGMGQDAMVMYRGWLLKTGLGKIFPSLYQRHDSRRQSSTTGSRAWLKARGLFSGKHPTATGTDTSMSRDTKTNADTLTIKTDHTRPSVDTTTASTYDDPLPSSKSDHFFKLSPTRPTLASRPSHDSRHSIRSMTAKADPPFDGLPVEGISSNATGSPTSKEGEDQKGVLVTKELWTEKESV